MSNFSNVADVYKQVGIGLDLYSSKRERDAGRHLHHLAIGAEWAAGYKPDGSWPEDRWIWDQLRDAIRAEGGSVRRRNAGGGFTETYLQGDTICTRQVAANSGEGTSLVVGDSAENAAQGIRSAARSAAC